MRSLHENSIGSSDLRILVAGEVRIEMMSIGLADTEKVEFYTVDLCSETRLFGEGKNVPFNSILGTS